jgi:hypothetical protein
MCGGEHHLRRAAMESGLVVPMASNTPFARSRCDSAAPGFPETIYPTAALTSGNSAMVFSASRTGDSVAKVRRSWRNMLITTHLGVQSFATVAKSPDGRRLGACTVGDVSC